MKKLLSGGDTRCFFMQSFFLHFVPVSYTHLTLPTICSV